MICNVCNDNSPDDAHYCINCGALLSYTGKTQGLYKRRYVPVDDIEECITRLVKELTPVDLGTLRKTIK